MTTGSAAVAEHLTLGVARSGSLLSFVPSSMLLGVTTYSPPTSRPSRCSGSFRSRSTC